MPTEPNIIDLTPHGEVEWRNLSIPLKPRLVVGQGNQRYLTLTTPYAVVTVKARTSVPDVLQALWKHPDLIRLPLFLIASLLTWHDQAGLPPWKIGALSTLILPDTGAERPPYRQTEPVETKGVAAAIEQGTLPPLPDHPVAMLRTLLRLGRHIWKHLPAAALWGAPLDATTEQRLVWALALLMAAPPNIPAPEAAPDPGKEPHAYALAVIDAMLDCLVRQLCERLAESPCPWSDADLPMRPRWDSASPMDPARAVALIAAAKSLAHAQPQRPLPRFLGRDLDLSIPRALRALTDGYDIGGMRIQVGRQGLWVALLDRDGVCGAKLWWMPSMTDQLPASPISIAPSVWLAVNLVLAAYWHDLHAQAVVITASPEEATERTRTQTSTPSQAMSRRRSGERMLPPTTRRASSSKRAGGSDVDANTSSGHTAWPDAEDDVITDLTACAGHYRILPAGWEMRQTRHDVQKRRQAAIARAQQNGHPPPPEGMTYVSPYVRAGRASRQMHPSVRVRSRGLLHAALALHAQLPAASDQSSRQQRNRRHEEPHFRR